MKKCIIFFILFLIILLIYEFNFNYLKSNHDIEYVITEDSKKYEINEYYVRDENRDIYYIKVNEKDSNKSYIFDVNNLFNKRKEIVKKVNEYKKDDVECLNITLVNDKNSETLCIKDNELYTYFTLKNELKIKELDESIETYGNDKQTQTISSLEINKGYLDEGENILFHFQRAITVINKEIEEYVEYGTIDNYKNTHGILCGDYYVIPQISNTIEFDTIVVYNILTNKSETINIGTGISFNSYYNGIHNDEIYITDRTNLRQYKINPKEMTIKLIATIGEKAYIYNDKEEERVSIYEVTDKKVYFNKVSDAYKKIKADKIYETHGCAYYYKNGYFYKTYEKYPEVSIKLFKTNDPKNVVIKEDNLYFIEYETIKKFNIKGLYDLAKYSELKSNYENVFDIYINKN